jgi:hypothetical protein
MKDAAFSGLAGRVVDFLAPHTEADRSGMLLTFLSAFGANVGSGPHAIADGTKHPARLNVVLVGRSSRARKGTAWAVVRRVFAQADPDFVQHRVIGGLTSGEGLVAALDERPEGLQRSVLVHEPEFARLLRVAGRSATLSALIREAWDGGDLAVLTRKAPLRVVGANVAVLGHVTRDELVRRLDATEIANGLGNRFLFVWVERSKRLPSGGQIPADELEALGVEVRSAVQRARTLGVLERSPQAEERWAEIYHSLDDDLDGVVGALSARAEAQMLRLSVAYALLDGSPYIEVQHVDAAQAVWDSCQETICRVFAGTQPDHVLSRLLTALREAGVEGLDGSAQRDLFNRHLAGTRLASARWELERRGLARTITEETGGRPRVVTRLTTIADQGRVSSLSSPSRSPFGRFEEPKFLGSDKREVPEASGQ